jgi:hypothetical protein
MGLRPNEHWPVGAAYGSPAGIEETEILDG